MDKHITLVGAFNAAYRGFILLWSMFLFAVAAACNRLFEYLIRTGAISMHDVPYEFLDVIPFIIAIIASLMFVVSVVGIIGSVGVLKRKEWGRIVLLIVSFFNLTHIPVGTALGVYTIWALLNDETIKAFRPAD
jgi:hypothetical protein